MASTRSHDSYSLSLNAIRLEMQALKETSKLCVADPRTKKWNKVSDLKPGAILSDVGV